MGEPDISWMARRGSGEAKDNYRLAVSSRIDMSRLIHSAAFRRLQGKTQVMGVGEHDFFRTRLTHSLEVAQIGASITERIRYLAQSRAEYAYLQPLLPPETLIEAACLAHDIGHPAFGHNGERILNYYMQDHGGFEGNGQTLRVLARLGEYSAEHGYDLTRRTMLAVLKYPALYRDVKPDYPAKPERLPHNIQAWHPPKCIHDDDAEILDWVLAPLSSEERRLFQTARPVGSHGQLRSQYKSFDCSIMELADDIAYGVHDLEDALATGLLHPEQAVRQLDDELKQMAALSVGKKRAADYYHQRLLSGERRLLKQAISNMVQTLVMHTKPLQLEQFTTPLLRHQVVFTQEAETLLYRLKNYVLENVVKTPALRTLEYKGQKIISELFESLIANPDHLLPTALWRKIEAAGGDEQVKQRTVCDYIASMSDGEAASMYQRLFLPGSGSVFKPL